MRSLFIGSAVLALAAPAPVRTAHAQAARVPAAHVTPAPGASGPDLSVTIYNSNLALVQDHRTVSVPAGRSRLELKDVSAAIEPETATLTGGGLTVREQNFDFDLLTPAKMMEKAVGHEVQIVRINPGDGKETAETATVLSANGGVVLKVGSRIEVLRDDGVPTRVIFDHVPETLRAEPTLSVMVDADHAGPRAVDLRYLTTGLSWKADYVALFDEGRELLDLQGWVTLTNASGTPFENARTTLVAGDVSMGGGVVQSWRLRRGAAGALVRTGTETSGDPSLGDLHLYALPERTTVADKQTKQVGILTARAVPAHKIYLYQRYSFASETEPQHAEVAVDFSNSSAAGLGRPLPAGTVRVYERDADQQAQFVGESPVGHTPQGSDLSLKIGEAFDVTVQPTLVSSRTDDVFVNTYQMSYILRNARAEPAVVEVRQGGFFPNGRVLKESLASRSLDAETRVWSVPVPARGQTTLTFIAQTGG
jgi:hypothetical protein